MLDFIKRLPLNKEGKTLEEVIGVKVDELPSNAEELKAVLEDMVLSKNPIALRKVSSMLATGILSAGEKSPMFTFLNWMFFSSPDKQETRVPDLVEMIEESIIRLFDYVSQEAILKTLELTINEIAIISSSSLFVLKMAPLKGLLDAMGAADISALNQKPI